MLTAEAYARIRALMCTDGRNCGECEIIRRAREVIKELDEPKTATWCEAFAVKFPAEAVKLTHLWWKENKERYGKF